jgi:hypothetical protein
MMPLRWCLSLLLAFTVLPAATALPPDLAAAVQTLRAVGPEGRGNADAAAAWRKLAAADTVAVPDLLAAMDGANDYALNWLRAAVEAIAQREANAGRKAKAADLEAFLADTKHHPRARRMAYEMIAQADPERARQLLPGFVNDPSPELRRDAVQRLADAAALSATSDRPAAIAGYRQALVHAREADQVDALAKKLADLGEKVDLQRTFGWVTRWKLIGPFDNTGGAGFAKAFPPEERLDYAAEYDGKDTKARWVDYVSKSDYGLVDFNQPFTPLKEVTGYAAAEFWSDSARPAEIRLGCKNGWKVWHNGRLLFGRDEYHRGTEMDHYRLPVELQAGKNVILVKCCQNEQKEDWTVEWEFQLRVTDPLGAPIHSTR